MWVCGKLKFSWARPFNECAYCLLQLMMLWSCNLSFALVCQSDHHKCFLHFIRFKIYYEVDVVRHGHEILSTWEKSVALLSVSRSHLDRRKARLMSSSSSSVSLLAVSVSGAGEGAGCLKVGRAGMVRYCCPGSELRAPRTAVDTLSTATTTTYQANTCTSECKYYTKYLYQGY